MADVFLVVQTAARIQRATATRQVQRKTLHRCVIATVAVDVPLILNAHLRVFACAWGVVFCAGDRVARRGRRSQLCNGDVRRPCGVHSRFASVPGNAAIIRRLLVLEFEACKGYRIERCVFLLFACLCMCLCLWCRADRRRRREPLRAPAAPVAARALCLCYAWCVMGVRNRTCVYVCVSCICCA